LAREIPLCGKLNELKAIRAFNWLSLGEKRKIHQHFL